LFLRIWEPRRGVEPPTCGLRYRRSAN